MVTKLIDRADLSLTKDAVIEVFNEALARENYGVFAKMTVLDILFEEEGPHFLTVTLGEIEQDKTHAA